MKLGADRIEQGVQVALDADKELEALFEANPDPKKVIDDGAPKYELAMSRETIRNSDEVFDASDPRVSNSARKFYKTQSIIQYPLHNTQTALHSPNRFSKYVAHSLFSAINLQKD